MNRRAALLAAAVVVVVALAVWLLLRGPDDAAEEPIDQDRTLNVRPDPGRPCDAAKVDQKVVHRFHPRRNISWHLQGCGGWGMTIGDIKRRAEQETCAQGMPANDDFQVNPPSGVTAPVVQARLSNTKGAQPKGTKEYYCYTLYLKPPTPPDAVPFPVDPEIEIIWP